MNDDILGRIHEAMGAIARRHQIVYDPRLLDGYDGFEGPLDHRRQLRQYLGRELENANPDWRMHQEANCEVVYNPPRRKGVKRVVPKIDIVAETRHEHRLTHKRTVNRYAITIAFAAPGGEAEDGALHISRHGRTGVMPATRADDTGYGFMCDVGNLEAMVASGDCTAGFAVLYSVYDGWREGVDAFYPWEGRTLEGKLSRPKTLMRKSTPAVDLKGTYELDWRSFAVVPQTAPPGQRGLRGDTVDRENFEVKYLVVPVVPVPDEA